MVESEFPVAEITPRKSWATRASKMWIVTLICVFMAIGLTLHSLRAPGPEIVIRFPEGHGLKAGDVIRHRGIDIGMVKAVDLSGKLDGVEVRATLDASADAIARDGSRFWIVRPRLDLTGVSGLETAVGSKYIAVIPGTSTISQFEFDGLAAAPPDRSSGDGIELVLRADQRWGLNPGSPITWRGVEVGQVLSSGLSPNALKVDTHIHIMEPYRRLVRRNSKFWVTSGIQMGFDVTGFELTTDSLASVARGGISFMTPGPDPRNQGAVRPGDVFTLHREMEDEWLESATAIDLLDMQPPPVSTVVSTWNQKRFGINRQQQRHASAITVASSEGATVYLPADLVRAVTDVSDESGQVEYRWGRDEVLLDASNWEDDPTRKIAKLSLGRERISALALVDSERLRDPIEAEDCFAIRRSWHSEEETAVVLEMIGKDELLKGDGGWRCTNDRLSRDVWHGAAVISSSDERVIGMLVVEDHLPLLVPLNEQAL